MCIKNSYAVDLSIDNRGLKYLKEYKNNYLFKIPSTPFGIFLNNLQTSTVLFPPTP